MKCSLFKRKCYTYLSSIQSILFKEKTYVLFLVIEPGGFVEIVKYKVCNKRHIFERVNKKNSFVI